MATLTIREYHPESGAMLGNISVLNFGKVVAGTHSRIKVLDVSFGGVTYVGNIKIGLISSGGLSVNPNPTDIGDDGSSSNGHFGIQHSQEFDASISSAPLSRHFAGINDDNTAGNQYNVSIENRSDTISEYIYLDLEIGSSNLNAGNGAYKIYFDYS